LAWATFSPDGLYLLTAGGDGVAWVWEHLMPDQLIGLAKTRVFRALTPREPSGTAAPTAAQPRGPSSLGAVSRELELARAAQKAVALAQQEKSTWTRADVIKYLGRVLPGTGRVPAAAAALLEHLADRALQSEFEPVICLETPEPAEVPASLLRADGRSIYRRYDGARYATRAQLVMEGRMRTQASAAAPRLTRASGSAVGPGRPSPKPATTMPSTTTPISSPPPRNGPTPCPGRGRRPS
jgi:hypothetical protein